MKIKSLSAILLASVLLLGSVPVYAAEPPDDTSPVTSGVGGINTDGFGDALEFVSAAGGIKRGSTEISLTDLSGLTVRPGDEISIRLDASMFLDRDREAFAAVPTGGPAEEDEDPVIRDISRSALRSGDITIKTASSRGGSTAEFSLVSDGGGTVIEGVFSDGISRIGDEFELAVYLAYDNDRDDETRIDIAGVVETEIHDVDGDGAYCDTSTGDGYEASGSARDVVFELGNGVTITRNVVKGRTYYGIALNDLEDKDSSVLDKYPGVYEVYRLQTSGLKAPGNIVRLESGGSDHVYNTYGLYLGTADSALPYWTTYYVSSEKYDYLDI